MGQRAQRGFDHVGEAAFVAAHRGDVDDARGEHGRVGRQVQFHPRSLTVPAGQRADRQRESALESAEAGSVPWIAASLARIEAVLGDLTG